MADEPQVVYTVKDLLAIQGKSLERIERKVDEGAIRQTEAIAKIDTRVSLLEQKPDLEPRVRVLEEASSEQRGERGYRRFLWPTVAIGLGGSWWIPDFIRHLNN